MRSPRALAGVVAGVVVFGLLACGPSLAPLPEPPDLSGVDASVRDQYLKLRAHLDGLDGASPVEQAAAQGELGMWFHAYRLPEAAELAYGNALILDPGAARWSYFRGVLFSQAGRPGAAAADFAAALGAGGTAAVVRLAEAETQLGSIDAAIERLEPVVKTQRRNVRARAALARALLSAEQPGEEQRRRAASLLEESLKDQPAASTLRYQLATLYRELGEPARAEGHFGLVEAEAKSASLFMPDPWGRDLEEMDVSYLGILGRGRAAAAADRHQRALRLFEQAQQIDPSRFAAAFAAAKSWLALGRDREARVACEQLVEAFPVKSEAQLLLGRLYRRDADPRSLDAFKRAVELDPESLPAVRQLAAEHRLRGEFEDALSWLEKARALDPAAQQVVLSLTDVLLELGRRERAVAVLREALPAAKEPWALELKLAELEESGR